MKLSKLIFFLALLLPTLVVYKNFLLPGPLAWGDAPHFLPGELKELFSEPLAWTNRGYNFGGANQILWLSPLMILYGSLNKFLELGNDIIIRLLFYLPSIMFAGMGSYLFSKHLKFSNLTQFFAVFVYVLNTYVILLIDGGQVGIALAYGLFPIALLFLKRLMDKPSLNAFFLALIFLSLLTTTDPRFAIIGLITLIVLQAIEQNIRPLKYLLPLTLSLIGINFYWIYPLLKNSSDVFIFSGASSNLSWYNPLLLFSPNWPENLFGKITKPPFYFFGVPVILSIGLFFKRNIKIKRIAICFLVFAIFVIGIPFVSMLPFGFAFRDSTKFFTPLVLFAGILIGNSVESFKIGPAFLRKIFAVFVYLFLLILLTPALTGKLNFVLSNRVANSDIQKINGYFMTDNNFYRSLWIPERYPLTYETGDHPALDGKDLVNLKPFALMNASEDQFNFLYSPGFIDMARVFGIKYLVLSDNPREIAKSDSDKKDWQTISQAVENIKGLEKIDLDTNNPVYKIAETYPRFYAVKKLNAIIGQPLINGRELLNSVYFEDGILDPHLLEDKDQDAAVLVFNNSDKTDLAMSLLQKYFLSPTEAVKREWAVYAKDQYLKYKYELLIRQIKFADLDFSKGIAFSTKNGEKMEYKFEVEKAGEYVLISRTMTPSKGETNLKWTMEPLTLAKGSYYHSFENDSELKILNVVGLVPKEDYGKAVGLADTFTKHFQTVSKNSPTLLDNSYGKVETNSSSTLNFNFTIPEGYKWIILNESYNPLWKSKRGTEYSSSLPIYSAVNGFYVENNWITGEIDYLGQRNMHFGFFLSVVSILVLLIIYLYFLSKKPILNKSSK